MQLRAENIGTEILLLQFLFVPELSAKGTQHISAFCLNLLSAELLTFVINCTSPGPHCFQGRLMSGTHLLLLWCLRQGAHIPRCFLSIPLQGSSGVRPDTNASCLFPAEDEGQAGGGHISFITSLGCPNPTWRPPWYCWAPGNSCSFSTT